MKTIKIILTSFLTSFLIFFVAGCSTNDKIKELENKISDLEASIQEKDNTIKDLNNQIDNLNNSIKDVNDKNNSLEEELAKFTFEIKVIDIDGVNLGSKKIPYRKYSNLWDALDDNFNVVASIGDYGHYISSINGSIVDNNYYVAIYENNEFASTGVDSIIPDAGDVFEFRVECWNTLSSGYGVLDKYDVLVDKTIYHYIKTRLKEVVEGATTYTNVLWEAMTIYLMSEARDSNGYNVYDSNLFKFSFSDTLKSDFGLIDVTSLSGANIGKYFYTARLLNNDLTNYKTMYTSYLSTVTSYNEYVSPFTLSPAYSLNLSSSIDNNVKNTTYRAATTWGTDGIAWQLTAMSLHTSLAESELLVLPTDNEGNATSAALRLLPYAAFNKNIRTVKNSDNKDLIEIIFDNYYDSELNIVKYNVSTNDYNFSSNQVYASLIAYKVQRDTRKVANLFA